ncbi:MAG: hypothetical protein KF767_12825 [Bdellovibrionaceae bacterium]|nr:hypothetical protein [Pseudobdellovibrionaceae bacterium]
MRACLSIYPARLATASSSGAIELNTNKRLSLHRFLAGNKELIIELYKDIQAAFDKAFEKSQQQKASNDAIFKVTFTAVDVLQTQRPEAGNGKGVK